MEYLWKLKYSLPLWKEFMSKNLFKPVRCAVYIWLRNVITRLGISCFRLVSSVIASLPWRHPLPSHTVTNSKEYTYTSNPPLGLLQGDLYLYLIYIYLIEMLLSSGTVSNSKFFSKCPAFKFLPRGHCSSCGCRFSLLLGVNVETLVLFEIVMWPIPLTTFPVHPLYRSLGVSQSRSIKLKHDKQCY